MMKGSPNAGTVFWYEYLNLRGGYTKEPCVMLGYDESDRTKEHVLRPNGTLDIYNNFAPSHYNRILDT